MTSRTAVPAAPGARPIAPPRLSAAELARLLGQPPPTDEQAEVIESALAPAAVIAGAGSGKTETMAARVVWLIANRVVDPAEVLGLTFTRKAAAELGARVRRRLGQWRAVVARDRPDDVEHLAQLQAAEPTVSTYAAFAGRLVGEHALRIGAEPDARLLSPALVWQLADTSVRRWGGPLPEFGSIAAPVQWVIAMAGQFADHLVEPAEVEGFCRSALAHFETLPRGKGARSDTPKKTADYVKSLTQRAALVPLVAAFRDAKRRAGSVDFADQMSLAAELAALPDVEAVERVRHRVVLLDEYQDTGHAQVVMLRGLFGNGHPVTAVGDPFQSIYGWRGASAATMASFDVTFLGSDRSPAAVFHLATSFRNERAVLDAANTVAAPLRATTATIPLRPHRGSGQGVVETTFVETVEDEAEWVADRMRDAWNELPPGGRTAAVLVRRRTQLPALADALRTVGLPVEIVGLGGLLTTPEVVDVVATLRVLADHRAGGALMRLLTGARWRMGPRDLAALHERARSLVRPDVRTGSQPAGDEALTLPVEPDREPVNLVEALDDPGPAAQYSVDGARRIGRLSGELRVLRRRLTAPLAELVAEIERTIGVDVEVAARADRAHVGRVHLDRFLDVAAAFAAEAGDTSLRAFLAFLDAAEDEENGLEAGEVIVATERVQLLTVHGAKGLEWDLVAVPGLATGLFPAPPRTIDWTRARHELPGPLRGDRDSVPQLDVAGAQSRAEVAQLLDEHHEQVLERHEAEERRLAYVACTRARSLLLTSGYAWDSTVAARAPSPYLTELAADVAPDHWFEPSGDAVNPRTVEPDAAAWPADPLAPAPGAAGGRRTAVEAGAALVRDVAGVLPGFAAPDLVTGTAPEPGSRAASWSHDVDVLLAERAQVRRGSVVEVELPGQLSVSQLVELRRNPEEFARALRRPLPRPPAPWARQGTAFHTWLEQRWQTQTLLDVDELPGSADEGAGGAAGAAAADLAALRAAFERSEWAARTPVELEVPFEMAVADRVVRGRMDAVFAVGSDHRPAAGDASGWVVVDWKTGRRPTGSAAEAAAVQLAAYRLAWARLMRVPDDQMHRVRAAFHYVRDNETVEPGRLLDADGLRELITRAAPPAAPPMERDR